MEDLFCKIYVLSELSRFQIAKFIGSKLEGDVAGKFISINELEIEIRENEDFDPTRSQAEDFLFYPIYLEIEPRENIKSSDYICKIGEILKTLREEGFKAIPACDFEDQLPIAVSST